MITYSIGDLVSESWDDLQSGVRKDMPEPRVGLVIDVNEEDIFWDDEENIEENNNFIVIRWSDQTTEKYELWGSIEEIHYLPIIG